MHSWGNIPQEIIEQIFNHLHNNKLSNNNDMMQCQLTCRNWCGSAQKELYKTINMNSITADKIVLFFQTVSSAPITPDKLVKTLNVGDYLSKDTIFKERNPISVNYFINLQNLFPNVEHLLAENASEIFWTKLIHERYNGNWQLLRGIPTSSPMEFVNYAYAAVACCSTLESLTLYYQPFRGRPDSRLELHISILTQNLKRFTNLTKLVIRVGEDDKGFLKYDSLLQDCQLLQCLALQVSPSYGNSPVLSTVTSPDEGKMDLSLIEPSSHIKYFEGSNCISNDNSAIYLIHKFPNLKKLTLAKSARSDFLSPYVKRRFFQHVVQIPNFKLTYWDLDNNNKSNLVDDAPLTVHIKYSSTGLNFFNHSGKHLFSFCSSREHVNTDDNQDSILYQNRTIYYNKHYEHTFNDELSILHEDKVILKYGTRMQKLSIDVDSTRKTRTEYDDIDSNFDINYRLRNVFNHCPFLQCLKLCNMNLGISSSSLSLSATTNYKSLNRLEIICSSFTDNFALMSLCAQFPSLNHLVLNKCIFYSYNTGNAVNLDLGLNTILGTLTLFMDGPLKRVYLEVVSSTYATNARYFKLEDSTWDTLPSGNEYEQALISDSQYCTISVGCKRLTNFIIYFDNGVHRDLQLVE